MITVTPRTDDGHVNQLCSQEARWFAVYTMYKREKIVRKELERKGIQSYLPLQTVTRYYTRKVKTVHLPLISCYLFVKITKPEYVPVLEVPGVLKFIRFKKDLISIPQREIDILRMVCGEEVEVEVTDEPLTAGDHVEIIGGRLTGLKGILGERAGKNRFYVNLDSIGIQLAMSVPEEVLRKTADGKRG